MFENLRAILEEIRDTNRQRCKQQSYDSPTETFVTISPYKPLWFLTLVWGFLLLCVWQGHGHSVDEGCKESGCGQIIDPRNVCRVTTPAVTVTPSVSGKERDETGQQHQ